MAVTGAITLSDSTADVGQPITAKLTLTNGGGSDVELVSVTPLPMLANALLLGSPNTGPGQEMTIAASGGTLVKTWDVVGLAPPIGSEDPTSTVYAIGADFEINDATADTATTSNLTVSAGTT